MEFLEANLDDSLMETLISMSAQWEAEHSCHGYAKNEPLDIAGNRIFLAVEGETVLGYLFGAPHKTEERTSVMAADTPYFEIEELYIRPERRSQGIGKGLMSFAEKALKGEGIPYLMLSTATKNYKAILHFYIEEMGMEFWSARLFKKL